MAVCSKAPAQAVYILSVWEGRLWLNSVVSHKGRADGVCGRSNLMKRSVHLSDVGKVCAMKKLPLNFLSYPS